MGFIKNLFRRNKPKQLMEGIETNTQKTNIPEPEQERTINSKSKSVYFDPHEWIVKTYEEKSKSVLLYTIEGNAREILVDIVTGDEQGNDIEINILRYSMNKEMEYRGKSVKDLIIRLLDIQIDEDISASQKIEYYKILQGLINEGNGVISKEGKEILGNRDTRPVTTSRTVFIEKDENNYVINYEAKDEISLMNKLIDIVSEPKNLQPVKEMIEVSIYHVNDENYQSQEEREDLLRGIINLCEIAYKLGIGKGEKEEQKYGFATKALEKAKKLNVIRGEENVLKLHTKLENVVVDSCIKLEDLIESFIDEREDNKDKILYSREEDLEYKNLLKKMLIYSKRKFKEDVERKNKKPTIREYIKKDVLPINTLEMHKLDTEMLNTLLSLQGNIIEYIKENPVNATNRKLITILGQAAIILEQRLQFQNDTNSPNKEPNREPNKDNSMQK